MSGLQVVIPDLDEIESGYQDQGAVFNDARVEVARVMTARLDKQNLAFWTIDSVEQVT